MGLVKLAKTGEFDYQKAVDFQKLTDSEQSCVSGKLSKKGGKPSKQDLAVVISECREEASAVASGKKLGYQQEGSHDFEIPGGDYTAIQNADGTWNIVDIEIYASHERRLPVGVKDGKLQHKIIRVGQRWLHGSLTHHQDKRDVGKFLYPLHVNHHEYCGGSSNQPVKGAAFFMPTRIGKGLLDGKMTDILYADFLSIKPEVYRLIREKGLPYRSAEILNINETIVSSVSLMEHDVPFFPFPLLTIGEEIPHPQAPPAPEINSETDVQHVAAMAQAVSYSLRKGGDMPLTEDEKIKEANAEGEKLTIEGMFKEIMGVLKALVGAGAPAAEPSVEEVPEEKEEEKPEASRGGEDDKPVEVPSAEHPDSDDEKKKMAAAKAAAGQEGKYDALKARLDKRDRVDSIREKVKGWVAELAPYNLGIDIEAKLLKKATEKGEAAAEAYVQSAKEHSPKIPPKTDPITGNLPAGSELPKEVMAYASEGQDRLALASVAYSQYDEAVQHGLIDGSMSREKWLKTQMSTGRNVPEK